MTSNETTIEQQLEPLANDLANALAEAKKATQRADEIKAEMRVLLTTAGPGDYAAGRQTVKAIIARTIDVRKIARDYPSDTHPYLYKLAPDVKLVRAHLDDEQVDRYLTDAGDMRIGLA